MSVTINSSIVVSKVWCQSQASAMPIAMAASERAHFIQGDAPHVQGSQHVVARLPRTAAAALCANQVAPLLLVPRTQTNIGKRAFSVTAPLTWNVLPNYVRQSDSLAIFKSRLKTALFTTAFDS